MIEQVHATLVSAVAAHVSRRVSEEAVAALRQQPALLSGDDSGLQNVWLEFCVQVQGEHSYDWDAYEVHVRQLIEGQVCRLAPFELQAVWLQTPAGADWCDEPDINPSQIPLDVESVVDSLYGLVWRIASDWEDDRIGRYLYPGDSDSGFDVEDDDEAFDEDEADDTEEGAR